MPEIVLRWTRLRGRLGRVSGRTSTSKSIFDPLATKLVHLPKGTQWYDLKKVSKTIKICTSLRILPKRRNCEDIYTWFDERLIDGLELFPLKLKSSGWSKVTFISDTCSWLQPFTKIHRVNWLKTIYTYVCICHMAHIIKPIWGIYTGYIIYI